MSEEIQADPELLAKEIKKFFAACKTDQTNKPYRPAQKFNKPEFWLAAAENCIRTKSDPYSFVRALFLFNNVSGGPYPNQLVGQHAVKCYHQYRQLHGLNPDTQQDVYATEIKSLITNCFVRVVSQKRVSVKAFLLDDGIRTDEIPAYVRILLMPKDREVLAMWEHTAYLELKVNPRLITILQELGHSLDFVEKLEN